MGCFFCLWRALFGLEYCREGGKVRIPRPKIEKLAFQAMGVGIFTKSEYPLCKHPKYGVLFLSVACLGGFEPSTYCLEGSCSILLS